MGDTHSCCGLVSTELSAGKEEVAARTLDVVDHSPQAPVDVAPRLQFLFQLEQEVVDVPLFVHCVHVHNAALAVDIQSVANHFQ